MLLQFFTQGIAIDTEHLGGVRLIAFGTGHHGLKNRLFYGEHHHFVDIGWLLLAQIAKIFFEKIKYRAANAFDGLSPTGC